MFGFAENAPKSWFCKSLKTLNEVASSSKARRARRVPPDEVRNKSRRAPFCASSLKDPRDQRLRGLFQGAFLFGWAPIAWIVFRHGLAPAGSFVLETNVSPQRFLRYAYL